MNLLDAVYGLTLGPHYLYHRFVTHKYGPRTREKTGRVPDRFTSATTAVMGDGSTHVEPPCLWLHAVSVGEAVAATELAALFRRDQPRWDMRFSTTTATGRAVAEKNWGAGNVFYYPLDFSGMVRRAFDNIRPTVVVLMELEIWPNFLEVAAERGVPVVVANARITGRSEKRLAHVPGITRTMARAVTLWLAQTEEYAARLKRIGVPPERIEVTGSVKYDAVPETLDAEAAAYYRRLFGCGAAPFARGGDLLVVGGSTHPGEEKTLLTALRAAVPAGLPLPRIVLAPRHPERLAEVEETARGFGTVVRRSALAEPLATEERGRAGGGIILVDTMGELAKIYAAADVVFVGGSFIRHGGQNFIEPCGLGKPTLVGPHLWNFQEPADLLRGKGCLAVVDSPAELGPALARLLASPQEAAALGARAREVLLTERGAARRMADRIGAVARRALLDRANRL